MEPLGRNGYHHVGDLTRFRNQVLAAPSVFVFQINQFPGKLLLPTVHTGYVDLTGRCCTSLEAYGESRLTLGSELLSRSA